MQNNYEMVAKTAYGLEGVLAKELRNLGAQHVKEGVRAVTFVGDKGFMYKANLCLRTCIKILKPIERFWVRDEKSLYNQVYKMDWNQYIKPDQTIAIYATVHSDLFSHSKYIALKTKDAIVDRIRDDHGTRPNIDTAHPHVQINVHIDKSNCTISLDTSGESLHKRGYRTATNIAPLNEVSAAGLLLLSGWDGQCDFLDPMCGSGTIPIEAAMIAANIPANLNRNEFAFEKWPDWDVDLYETIEDSMINKIRNVSYSITGYDKAPSAVNKAKDNVKNANLQEFVTIRHEDFFKTKKETEGPLHIVSNPPYGERIAIESESFYGNIGTTLKHGYPGTNAWMITSDIEALKYVGLRPSRKIKLYNGKLEARFVKYEMYEGSKKAKKQNQ
ncbi:THUMP domain-containing class I SAM-dependent RNA methyltransferase [Spongiivirga citrea]|uniref:Class I SAM-dependent RNA methyltransferase n=1 Tax=Spongiivirga citrea TaxID=1481457 RepID=A0A6M0CES0_9FLAO|nr:class I SAM-dependent RNA methyltransferase [Spongiivirga citrea]NER16315.1 class I SAM-dependent RNA methyltransferase [Spongiivirga citrea]